MGQKQQTGETQNISESFQSFEIDSIFRQNHKSQVFWVWFFLGGGVNQFWFAVNLNKTKFPQAYG